MEVEVLFSRLCEAYLSLLYFTAFGHPRSDLFTQDQTSQNPPVLGPSPVKTAEDQWKPLLWWSDCPVKIFLPFYAESMGNLMTKK